MYKGIIYRAESPVGKKYYGQTVQKFKYRKSRHIRDARNGSNWRFHQALRKYGNDNFRWEVIETYNNENKKELINKLNERETYWVRRDKTNLFKYGYNSSFGGDNALANRRPHSQETKEKIKNSLIGVKHTQERKNNISKAHKGKDFSKNFGPIRSGSAHPSFINLSEEQIDKIIKLHTKDLKTAKQIAPIIGVCWAKILKLLKEKKVYIDYTKLLKLRKC